MKIFYKSNYYPSTISYFHYFEGKLQASRKFYYPNSSVLASTPYVYFLLTQ